MYVKAEMNGKPVRVMLDTGATNNFLSVGMVDHLCLKVVRSNSQVKAEHSKAQGIQGTATTMVRVGTWQQEWLFLALPMDDFEIIMGLDFFVQAKGFAIPHLGGLMISDESCPSFVPVERGQSKEKPLMQSASQVKTGLKKGETTNLAALVEIKPDKVVEVPDEIAAVLDEYSDVMKLGTPLFAFLRLVSIFFRYETGNETIGSRRDFETAGAKSRVVLLYRRNWFGDAYAPEFARF